MQASELEAGLSLPYESQQNLTSVSESTCAAIIVGDPTTRRLLEGLSVQLELSPHLFDSQSFKTQSPDLQLILRCEVIIADEWIASAIREIFRDREQQAEGVYPALIAVRYRSPESNSNSNSNSNAVRDNAARDISEQSLKPQIELSHPNPELHRNTLDLQNQSPNFTSQQGRKQGERHDFEAVLILPHEPSLVLAQLSVALYAHRAFVRRFQSALDELHLNRRIFRSVTSGISVADATRPDLPLVYVNPAFEVMTGYSLEEVQGRNCRFLQGVDRSQPALTIVREAIASGRESTTVLKNYRKDGSAFWNELSLSPIRSREGKITHIVGIQMDVTARVEFEAALRESEKLAAVGRLAASIAHEINNPLESVTNLLYLARQAPERPEMMRYLDMADRELQRASLITSQSLRFYRQSTKAQAIKPAEMLESVLDLYQGKLENAGIKVLRRERLTDSVVCLESEIRQVLTNLIRNAIDAMNGNGGKLFVRSRHATEWRTGIHGVLITIADTGSGISPEAMKNLYTAFFTTKGIGGTGLGLWVSAEIIKRHHGRLRVRSRNIAPQTWTVFELFLPYQGLGAE